MAAVCAPREQLVARLGVAPPRLRAGAAGRQGHRLDRGGVTVPQSFPDGAVTADLVGSEPDADRSVGWRHTLLWLALAALAGLAIVGFVSAGPTTGSALLPAAQGEGVVQPASAVDPAPVSAEVYVVKPGDTLWSIAAMVAPGADLRPVVDELAGRAGGASLQVGQIIAVDGLGDR